MEIASLIISIIVGLIAIPLSFISLKLQKDATEQQEGDLEMQVRALIYEACRDLHTRRVDYEESLTEHHYQAYKSSLEIFLTAYNDACGWANDKKLNMERFKKMFATEIRNIFELTKEHELLRSFLTFDDYPEIYLYGKTYLGIVNKHEESELNKK